MKGFSYKKAGWLLFALGLFSSPSYAFLCSVKYSSIAEALAYENITCAKTFILSGDDVDLPHKGLVPLMYAVVFQDKELVALLIERNANPYPTFDGQRALEIAFELMPDIAQSVERITPEDIARLGISIDIFNMLTDHEASYSP